eukprot:6211879-Pleurochrysis_carterae.AAC.2
MKHAPDQPAKLHGAAPVARASRSSLLGRAHICNGTCRLHRGLYLAGTHAVARRRRPAVALRARPTFGSRDHS